MVKRPEAVAAFLSGRRIGVAGVSRQPAQPANAIFRKLKRSGYDVFPINPNATNVEGVTCYRDVGDVPGRLDGVVIATAPAVSVEVVKRCRDCGVPRVWLHRSFGAGSVSKEAVSTSKDLGVDCIVGGCPMMFCEPVDFGHTCMRWWLQHKGRVPR